MIIEVLGRCVDSCGGKRAYRLELRLEFEIWAGVWSLEGIGYHRILIEFYLVSGLF